MCRNEPPSAHHVRVSWATRLKWHGFQLLERLSDLRGNAAAGHLVVNLPDRPVNALWVFVSTIGELNAIEPFLKDLADRLPHLRLVLISDHPHYRDSYLARYPHAEVCITRGHREDARTLRQHFRPSMLVVAEIPCLPSDAPCRFSFAFVLEARQSGALVALVNGWLYHYAPACRMDAIERRLFQRDYLQSFDVLCVQTDDTARHLIGAGARPEAVSVTGNIKFDGMQRTDWDVAKARSPRLLAGLVRSGRPIIVAGCVTSDEEQSMVLDAFDLLRQAHPHALIVLAPRHPEVESRMHALRKLLGAHQVHARFRSSLTDEPIGPDVTCLVLDTIGDLRDFYAAADVAHVGVDHNVLEPLAFGKPVTVSPGWDQTFPSWPVYQVLLNAGALLEARSPDELFQAWEPLIRSDAAAADSAARIGRILDRSRGAVAKHFAAIEYALGQIQAAPARSAEAAR